MKHVLPRRRGIVWRGGLLWALAIAAAAVGCGGDEETLETPAPESGAGPKITISPALPADIPGGANNADLATAAAFAWQEFIALNWPAVLQNAAPNTRGVPNTGALFGDRSNNGPLVWHTFRSKVEIFPGVGNPPGYDSTAPSYGFDAAPQYNYADSIGPATGQTPPAQPAWINLDETTQIGLNNMYAGVVPGAASGGNSVPQLIRFLAKGNRQQYNYIAANKYWISSNLIQPVINFKTAINANPPTVPKQPYVSFDTGTIEIKSAWRPLAPTENPKRFYTTTVRFYEQGGTGNTSTVYREEVWAMVALHIIHKTPTAPAFVFATFEQADNILNPDGTPVEDINGRVINRQTNDPTTPTLTYTPPKAAAAGDSVVSPSVTANGSYCDSSMSRLFFHDGFGNNGLPTGGNICVNGRMHGIPPAVILSNQAAHNAMTAYATQNKLDTLPWMYYKLVNVQSQPFDKSSIDTTNPDGKFNPATFYQANIVVETDYTLQMFSGLIYEFGTNGAPSDYQTYLSSDSTLVPFKNVYLFGGSNVTSFTMGGCMGCHGNAQVSGFDFSFILEGGAVSAPEIPQAAVTSPQAQLAVKKYHDMF